MGNSNSVNSRNAKIKEFLVEQRRTGQDKLLEIENLIGNDDFEGIISLFNNLDDYVLSSCVATLGLAALIDRLYTQSGSNHQTQLFFAALAGNSQAPNYQELVPEITNQHLNTLKLLLSKGADPFVKGGFLGRNIIQALVNGYSQSTRPELGQVFRIIIEHLIEYDQHERLIENLHNEIVNPQNLHNLLIVVFQDIRDEDYLASEIRDLLIRLNHNNPIEINEGQIVAVAAVENLPETFDIDGNLLEEHQNEVIEVRAVASQNLKEVDVVNHDALEVTPQEQATELAQEEGLNANLPQVKDVEDILVTDEDILQGGSFNEAVTAAETASTEDANAFILPVADGTFIPGVNASAVNNQGDDVASILLALELQHPLPGTSSSYNY